MSPVLLSSNRSSAAGVGWVDVDSTCVLSYQVRAKGLDPAREALLTLKDYPMEGLHHHSGSMMPGRERELRPFRGTAPAGGRVSQVHKLTMARLDAGDAALEVRQGAERIEGRIQNVR